VRSREQSETELLVVLQAELVPGADVPPGVFVKIVGPDDKSGAKS
jgi:hypothetical protein